MIKFIHTADIHFGVENYGRIDQKTGIHSRLLDFKRALDFCIDTAIQEDVDLFVFAGDAYKTAHPSPTQQKLLMECFFRLYRANIPAVIVIGNHDNPLSFGKATALDVFGNLPVEGFYMVNKPASLRIATKNGPVQIVAIPWPARTTIAMNSAYVQCTSQELADHIAKTVGSIVYNMAQELDPTLPAILAGHLTVSSGIFSGSEKRAIYGTDPVLLPSQLAIAPFDYVALGHLHRYQQVNKGQHPAIVYAGSIERVDFGERKEDKGFCLVTIHNKQQTDHTFIKTPMRPFIQLDIYLHDEIDQTEQIVQALQQHDLVDAVIKIIYHLKQGMQDTVNIRTIQQACAQTMYLVGIIPVRPLEARQRRSTLHVEMDLPTLLNNYFESKELSQTKKAALIERALALQHALDEIEHEDETTS